jgi:hypothetical protein
VIDLVTGVVDHAGILTVAAPPVPEPRVSGDGVAPAGDAARFRTIMVPTGRSQTTPADSAEIVDKRHPVAGCSEVALVGRLEWFDRK